MRPAQASSENDIGNLGGWTAALGKLDRFLMAEARSHTVASLPWHRCSGTKRPLRIAWEQGDW